MRVSKQRRFRPPSTTIVWPVTYRARSEARKQTTSPNSRGVAPAAQRDLRELLRRSGRRVELVEPRRRDPAGRDAVHGDALRAELAASVFSQPVSAGPERVREREVRRRLLRRERADGDDPPGRAPLEMRQRRGGRASRRAGTALVGCSSDSGGVAVAGPGGGPPQFQTRTSRPPKRSTAVATAARGRRRSSRRRDGDAADPVGLALELLRRRANMTTFAPSSASASALASPSPDEAPQTSAVRPLSPRSMTPATLRSWRRPGSSCRRARRTALDLDEARRTGLDELLEHLVHDLLLKDLAFAERGQVVAELNRASNSFASGT